MQSKAKRDENSQEKCKLILHTIASISRQKLKLKEKKKKNGEKVKKHLEVDQDDVLWWKSANSYFNVEQK